MKNYIIREIQSQQELEEVYKLTHDSLVKVGDIEPQVDGKIISYPQLDELVETTILVAVCNGKIIGTTSVMKDNPLGLPTDKYFKETTDSVRTEGRRLCSGFRIAITAEYNCDPGLGLDLIKANMKTLICKYNFQTALFTFNPRHEKFYQLFIGMETIARRESPSEDEIDANMILMRWDIEKPSPKIAELVKEYTALRQAAERPIFKLYPLALKKVS